MAKKPSSSQEIQSEQSERFIEAAKALESDETGAKFDAAIDEILPSNSTPKSGLKIGANSFRKYVGNLLENLPGKFSKFLRNDRRKRGLIFS